jgi:hypothetical protein
MEASVAQVKFSVLLFFLSGSGESGSSSTVGAFDNAVVVVDVVVFEPSELSVASFVLLDHKNEGSDILDTVNVPVNELIDKITWSELFLYDISESLFTGQNLNSTPSKLSVMTAGAAPDEAECGGNVSRRVCCEAIRVGIMDVLVLLSISCGIGAFVRIF